MGQPLPIFSPAFTSRHLTVVIYWRQRTGIDSLQNGHAALIIDTVPFALNSVEYYVSWLSAGKAMVNRAEQATFIEDTSNWGGAPTQNGDSQIPNRWVALKGLNVGGMKAAWDTMRTKEGAHWKLFDKNCATAVARILKAGGGDDFARSHKKQLVWWPTDLLKYARSMGSNVFADSRD